MTAARTRAGLCAAALSLFAVHGYEGTSLQQIASSAGVSKASLLYHFTSKEALLVELLREPTEALAALVDGLEAIPDEDERREAALRGFIDLALGHRTEMALLVREGPQLEHLPTIGRLVELAERLRTAMTGVDPALHRDVCVAVAFAGVIAACVELPEVPAPSVREPLLAAARAALLAAPAGGSDQLPDDEPAGASARAVPAPHPTTR